MDIKQGKKLNKVPRQKIKKSIRYASVEAATSSITDGLTEKYYSPMAIALGANVGQIGILNALGNIVCGLLYLRVPDILRILGSRKRATLLFVLLDAVSFLLVPLVPFLFTSHRIEWFIFFYLFSVAPGVLAQPVTDSWLSDLIPVSKRGKYFSLRSTIVGFFSVLASFFAGWTLDGFVSRVFVGFAIIFGLAAISRGYSWFLYWRIYEPELPAADFQKNIKFFNFLREIRNSDVGKFVMFAALLQAAANIAAPFYVVYLLEDLKYSYFTFILVICAAPVAKLIILRYWGRLSDKWGNLHVLNLMAPLIPLTPILWLLSPNFVWLMFVQFLSGLVWASYDLCIPNYLFEGTPSSKRTAYMSYYYCITSLFVAGGTIIGSVLVTLLPAIKGYQLLSLFLLSGILRGLVVFILLPQVGEVRIFRGLRRRLLPHKTSPGQVEGSKRPALYYDKPDEFLLPEYKKSTPSPVTKFGLLYTPKDNLALPAVPEAIKVTTSEFGLYYVPVNVSLLPDTGGTPPDITGNKSNAIKPSLKGLIYKDKKELDTLIKKEAPKAQPLPGMGLFYKDKRELDFLTPATKGQAPEKPAANWGLYYQKPEQQPFNKKSPVMNSSLFKRGLLNRPEMFKKYGKSAPPPKPEIKRQGLFYNRPGKITGENLSSRKLPPKGLSGLMRRQYKKSRTQDDR